jgi:hypothetical protein
MKISIPISSIYNDSLLEHVDCLEARGDHPPHWARKVHLYHSELQLIHELSFQKIIGLENTLEKYPFLKVLSFHAATNCPNYLIENGVAMAKGIVYDYNEMMDNIGENLHKISARFSHLSILIENNNYFPAKAYDTVTKVEFFKGIFKCYPNLKLLFDLAHAQISAINENDGSYFYRLSKLPIGQVHVSRVGYDNYEVKDFHEKPLTSDLKFAYWIARNSEAEHITVEYYKDQSELVSVLKELRLICKENQSY